MPSCRFFLHSLISRPLHSHSHTHKEIERAAHRECEFILVPQFPTPSTMSQCCFQFQQRTGFNREHSIARSAAVWQEREENDKRNRFGADFMLLLFLFPFFLHFLSYCMMCTCNIWKGARIFCPQVALSQPRTVSTVHSVYSIWIASVSGCELGKLGLQGSRVQEWKRTGKCAPASLH